MNQDHTKKSREEGSKETGDFAGKRSKEERHDSKEGDEAEEDGLS